MTRISVDSITAEVIGNSFQTIVEEMGVVLIRSAFSTNIKERRDCSCALFDSNGNLVSLAEHIPIHLASMQGLAAKIVQNLKKWELKPGDVIIANDPYLGGGSHLPDITLARPVFYRKKIAGFLANIAHWSDVGGQSPGVGTAGSSAEIFQEGLRIPPVRIFRREVLNQNLFDLMMSNMRGREERKGDFRAQTASLKIGENRLLELFNRYGQETLAACMAEFQDYSERLLRGSLRKIPEGTCCFEDFMDDDGLSQKKHCIRVAVKISHGVHPGITFDFNGTSPQAEGGINMVRAALDASVFYAVKALISPNAPPNAGFQRPIHIHAPARSLVNAAAPAAVGGRTDTCQRVVDAIMGALSTVIPERVTAASNGATTALIFGGTEKHSGRDFVYVEALGGGMGARYKKDGLDGVQVHITNTSNLPVEAMEMEYPLRVLSYSLVKNSGGPGKFRGGLAIRKDIQALSPLLFSAHSDRHRIAPWGLEGGLPGSKGRFLLKPRRGDTRRLPSKISGALVKTGDILCAQTAGGGGFGHPQKRQSECVIVDLNQGKISRSQAKNAYGVILTKKNTLDLQATRRLRKKLNKRRG